MSIFPQMLAFYLAYKEYNKVSKKDHFNAQVKCKEVYYKGKKIK